MNERDSEAVAAMLSARGYDVVSDESIADAILLNTCAVRELAEKKAMGKAYYAIKDKAHRPQLKVGIMGCMAQNRGATLFKKLPGLDLVVGTQKIHHIPELLDRLFEEKERDTHSTIVDLDAEVGSQNAINLHMPGKTACAFVSIMQGCNMHCTYCIVPKTRGSERCRPIADIVAECRKLADGGVKEVTLLGQIVTSYGRSEIPSKDGKCPFVQLIEAVAEIDGIERIRFTSPHPRGFGSDLVEAFSRIPKLMPSVQLPIQSGSNRILKAMNRPYSVEKYLEIVDSLRKAVPDISVSTDIIVGFPGETDEDFDATEAVFKKVRYDMAYIFKYSRRPGAPGGDLKDDVPEDVKEARNQRLLSLLEEFSIDRHSRMIGTVQKVLVEGPARRGENRWMGHTPGAFKVVFGCENDLSGKIVNVKITSATMAGVEGDPA
jgi:tRNA-2-methylthio-N6-dimethylallyladenosine synthase